MGKDKLNKLSIFIPFSFSPYYILIVEDGVGGTGHNLKIVWFIIKGIFVNMMDNFIFFKFSPKNFFHDKLMLTHPPIPRLTYFYKIIFRFSAKPYSPCSNWREKTPSSINLKTRSSTIFNFTSRVLDKFFFTNRALMNSSFSSGNSTTFLGTIKYSFQVARMYIVGFFTQQTIAINARMNSLIPWDFTFSHG